MEHAARPRVRHSRPAGTPGRSLHRREHPHPHANRSRQLSAGFCSGAIVGVFLSSTADCSATRCATAAPTARSTGSTRGGWSMTPRANIVRTMCCTMASSCAGGTAPFSTAALSLGPYTSMLRSMAATAPWYEFPDSWSRPATAASSVLWTAPQSDITYPWKPQSRRKTSVRRNLF